MVKYVFLLERWNFELIGNFEHTTEFLTTGKALLITLTSLPPNVNDANIN